MTRMLLEIALIIGLLLVNGLLAMSEIAVVTARRARLERLAAAGQARARAALALADQPTQFLSTVQVGITLVGILAGALGGATVSRELAARLAAVPALAPWATEIAFTVVVTVTTYLSLILGELVPKRIGMGAPERVALLVARPMMWLARVGGPLVRLLVASTEGMLRLLGLHRMQEATVTDDDVRALLAQGRAGGTIHAGEERIVARVLRLGDRPAAAVMTPRTELDWVEPDEDPDAVRQLLRTGGFAALLVAEGSVDNVIGVAPVQDLLRQHLEGRPFDLRAAAVPPLFLPETTPLLRVLDHLRGTRAPLAIVLDEFGGVLGTVTLGDVLQDLFGELPGLPDVSGDSPAIVARPDGGWLVDGALAVEELVVAVGLRIPEDDRRGEYRTVAGLVLTRMGRLPRVGECVEAYGHRFEVLDLDGHRIDRVLVTRTASPGDGVA
jgi:putative hemolysin